MKRPTVIQKVREILRLKHYSYRTEQSYVYWIRKYMTYHKLRHPRDLGEAEIRDFLSYLAVTKQVAASTQNQALNALVFLYRFVLEIEPGDFGDFVRSKKPKRLPTVFTKEEALTVLGKLEGRNWLIASLLYGAGLRLTECLRLRVKDIDFSYNQIIVRDAKGNRDRITLLPASIKSSLSIHLKEVKKLHLNFLNKGFGSVELPMLWPGSIPMLIPVGAGSMASRQMMFQSIPVPG